MCRYRINSDEMNLTHEFLSIMLGVHRRGVTIGSAILLSLCGLDRMLDPRLQEPCNILGNASGILSCIENPSGRPLPLS